MAIAAFKTDYVHITETSQHKYGWSSFDASKPPLDRTYLQSRSGKYWSARIYNSMMWSS